MVFSVVSLAWVVLLYVQSFLGYGTAYRYTKRGGDSGIALFGWMIVFQLAALIPGLGIYLWHKSKKLELAIRQPPPPPPPWPPNNMQ
jgi:hypothetical protein